MLCTHFQQVDLGVAGGGPIVPGFVHFPSTFFFCADKNLWGWVIRRPWFWSLACRDRFRFLPAKDWQLQKISTVKLSFFFNGFKLRALNTWVFSQTTVGSEWDWVRLGPSHNSRSSCRLQACSGGQCVEIGKCADCSNMEWRGRGGVTVTELENLFKFDVI